MNKKTDIIIVGTGAAGLFAALNLPHDKQILMISKKDIEECDSYLAQGGICVLRDEEDFEEYFEDTLKAGHYKNNKDSVKIMIQSSRDIIHDLISYGVEFENENGELLFTREGGHRSPRILFHADITGREITEKLIAAVKKLPHVTILPHTTMIDILEQDNTCHGIVCLTPEGERIVYESDYTILASGGLGGLYKHSTNFRHITGDALAIASRHGIHLKNMDYIQIHPTTLYSEKPGRRFLISESVRGEGAVLLDANKNRFVDELLPRDVVTRKIYEQMEKDGIPFVWLDMESIPKEEILGHFPNIYKRCLEEGYDCTKECIPVVPAQHYFMGGIDVDLYSKTSMSHLYAAGETSCNGVHGANRLASNSLLESLVFAKRAALQIAETYEKLSPLSDEYLPTNYPENIETLKEQYKKLVLDEIERMRAEHD